MEKINAVIFDWGGVLIEDPAPALFKYCANAFGVSVEQYVTAFDICINAFQTGAVTEKQFWMNMTKRLNVPMPKADSLWTEAFIAAYRPRQEMFSLASRLRKAGCKTAILSNTEKPVVEIINKQKYDAFDVTILSCLEGTAKPGRKIYDLALDQLGIPARQTLFIDDKPENIDGAKQAGLQTILFKNTEKFKKDMAGFFPNIV
ncbi:MAG: HAD family phosphatase [Sedimentisphaerales bacterium]|jgi:epoxide hydrolase-like predicted phosphatase